MTNGRGASATIRALMHQRRVRQQDLGRVLGLSQPQVSQRLSGRTEWSERELRAVATYLEVPVGDLFEPPALLVDDDDEEQR